MLNDDSKLVRFDRDGLELVINESTGECFASQSATARMCETSESNIRYMCTSRKWERISAEVLTERGLQSSQLLNEDQIGDCLAKYNPSLLVQCLRAGLRVYLHRLAGYDVQARPMATSSTPIDTDRQPPEKALLEQRPTMKQIEQAGRVYGRLYGKAYEQQYIHQKYQRWYPALAGQPADPVQVASLPSTKHRLTPSAIAEQLGLFHSTGTPNGNAANKMLDKLGYQHKVGKVWIPTEKAIIAGLVDRKPVDTNSRTQKDQLLWSADVLPILQKHTEVMA